ncbi:AAEL007338-PA [Aedes aegypti]|uniref:AAEL007338-PA n=1 Tax=Aedes aegypti TaxID=7159 RepID=Q172M6_AEDAE|nr:AAEL007338-PA [Aedes aegypti]
MMASSMSCRFLSSSSPSAWGTSSFLTSSSARLILIDARFSVSSTVISTCRSSDRCSQFGLPRLASSFFLSRIEPFPRTIILHPVSCSSCLAVIPRGPRILPTKLKSGCSFTGTYTFSFKVIASPSGSGSCSGSFVTPLIWKSDARTLDISSSSKRSTWLNTLGKAANCFRSLSSCAK